MTPSIMISATGTFDQCSTSVANNFKFDNTGDNNRGPLGQGDWNYRGDDAGEMGDNLTVVDLGSGFDVEQVSCGGLHTCVLSTRDQIKCFGNNDDGQLGCGNAEWVGTDKEDMGDNLSVVNLGSDFVAVHIDCGYSFSCAISASSRVKCWGSNKYGQLGQGDTTNRGNNTSYMGDNLTSIDLGAAFNASRIRCGYRHVCATSTSDDVKCWGANDSGQLGLGDKQNRGDGVGEMGDVLPVLSFGAKFVPELVGGGYLHNLALSTTGALKAWGFNYYGQLGYEDTSQRGDATNEMGDHLAVIDVGTGYTVASVASSCYNHHSCALLENGTDFLGLKCWGYNRWGQLGLGDTENRGDYRLYGSEMGDHLSFVSISFPALPTTFPTTTPSVGPTEPTESPSNSPTTEPNHIDGKETNLVSTVIGIGSVIVVVCLFIGSALFCVKEINTRKQWKNSLKIKSGMIISIGIGEYGPRPLDAEAPGYFTNLPVGTDVENLRNLSDYLHYPFMTVNDKLSWNKDEVMEFLDKIIREYFLDEGGVPRYDGLIVAISSHGVGNNIVSSDYKLINRTDIHRSISDKYPQIRVIPRIFLFDACDGTRSRQSTIHLEQRESVTPDNTDVEDAAKPGNDAEGNDLVDALQMETAWTKSTKNPDYNMIVVHGSNDGFVSKMNKSEKGSYLTYYFIKMVRERIEKKNRKGMYELLMEIQDVLHDKGKQMIKISCFNRARNLRIERGTNVRNYQPPTLEMSLKRPLKTIENNMK